MKHYIVCDKCSREVAPEHAIYSLPEDFDREVDVDEDGAIVRFNVPITILCRLCAQRLGKLD